MFSFGFSLAARFIQLVLGFFNIFLISRYLGPWQYGSYAFITSFVLIFVPAIDLSLNHIITREITQSGDKKLSLIKASLLIRLVIFLFLLPLILFSSKIFAHGSTDLTYLVLIYCLVLLNYSFSGANSYFIATYKLQFPSFINIAMNLLNTSAIFLSVKLNFPLHIILLFQAGFPLLSSLILYRKVYPVINHGKLNTGEFKFFWKEVKYLAVAGIFTSIYFRINSAIIFGYLGAESTGIFNSAYKFIDLANPIISVIMLTVFPKINEIVSGKEKRVTVNDLFLIMLFLGACTAIIVFNFSEQLIKIVYGEKFLAAVPILRILSISYILIFAGNVMGFLTIAYKLQKQYLVTAMSAAFLNVTALNFVVPIYGVTGTSVIAVLTELITTTIFCSFLIKHKCFKPDTKVFKAAVLIVVSFILSYISKIQNGSPAITLLLISLFVVFSIAYGIIPQSIIKMVFNGKRIGYNTNI